MKSIGIHLLVLLFLSVFTSVHAQCILQSPAVPGITLTYVQTNMGNCSGVAYNPGLQLYYAVRAGNSGFPYETWDDAGSPLYQTTSGFDFRGLWWNPGLSQLEGNGYNTYGLWRSNLNASGYALNTGSNIFTGMNQPNSQSCGDLDYDSNEIVYYYNGSIYRYSRATNAYLGNYPLIGLPVATSNLNWTTVVYTGCAGMEIGVLDYVNKRIYLFDKSTGNYTGMSQLPGSAVTTSGFRFSWANGMAWLFDLNSRTWFSFNIFNVVLPLSIELTAEKATRGNKIQWQADGEQDISEYVVERSLDGTSFESISTQSAANENSSKYEMYDRQAPAGDVIWYRIRVKDVNGNTSYSKVALIVNQAPEKTAAIFIWPNPAEKATQVAFELPNSSYGEIAVCDQAGRQVLKRELTDAEWNLRQLMINVNDWPDGFYFISITGNSGEKVTQKMSVIH